MTKGAQINFSSLADELLRDAPNLLSKWFPAGFLRAREYIIGNLRGDAGESLSINIDKGVWKDFSSGESGGDLISLYAAIHSIGQGEAAKILGGSAIQIEDSYVQGERCHPIPRHKHGKPSCVFEYKTPDGKTMGYISRFDPLNEEKQFAPLSCWKTSEGKLLWKWKKWPIATPPYHIDKAISNPQAKILILEGEKKADRAQKLLPDGWIAIGWCGGAEAVKKTDWHLLKSRHCVIWPDNDIPGIKAAHALKKMLPDLQIISLPEALPAGWDLGDADDDFDILKHIAKAEIITTLKKPQSREKIQQMLVMGGPKNSIVTINNIDYEEVKSCLHNVMILTEEDESLRGCLTYNIFADDIFFIKSPPWEDPEKFIPHPLRDDEILNYRAWVDTRGLKVNKNDAWDVLIAIARRNITNPPEDYFESLVWDNFPRLDNWLKTYLGATEQSGDYLGVVGSKWLMAAVKRIYEPGCKFDCVLILEGDQYLGKSGALERLATFNNERYFTDENIEFTNKDSLLKLQGKLIFEMAELASFKKAETDVIKGFTRRSIDEYRPLYGRKPIPRPRMFVIAGSVNPIAGYLTDPTGNTRYWPVKCTKADWAAIERDKMQLWAEAVYRYKKGEKIWLEGTEHKMACLEQNDRMVEDIISHKILALAKALSLENWTKDFFFHQLVTKLDIPISQQDGKMRLRITDCLVSNGYIEYRPRVNGEQMRKWKLKSGDENC